jgi:hypothetical protein
LRGGKIRKAFWLEDFLLRVITLKFYFSSSFLKNLRIGDSHIELGIFFCFSISFVQRGEQTISYVGTLRIDQRFKLQFETNNVSRKSAPQHENRVVFLNKTASDSTSLGEGKLVLIRKNPSYRKIYEVSHAQSLNLTMIERFLFKKLIRND